MSDLPRQLRDLHTHFGQAHDVLLEAAAEIERLRRMIEAMERAEGRGGTFVWDLP